MYNIRNINPLNFKDIFPKGYAQVNVKYSLLLIASQTGLTINLAHCGLKMF